MRFYCQVLSKVIEGQQMDTHQRIRNYLTENFLFSGNGFSLDDDASLLDTGIVDSTGVLEVILFVEETFEIEVADEDVTPDNFDSVNRIAAYVASKSNGRPLSADMS